MFLLLFLLFTLNKQPDMSPLSRGHILTLTFITLPFRCVYQILSNNVDKKKKSDFSTYCSVVSSVPATHGRIWLLDGSKQMM